MGEVKDMMKRLERWTEAHRCADLTIKISSQGRMMLSTDEQRVVLTFVESMQALHGILREYRAHGFATDEGPQGPEPDASTGVP